MFKKQVHSKTVKLPSDLIILVSPCRSLSTNSLGITSTWTSVTSEEDKDSGEEWSFTFFLVTIEEYYLILGTSNGEM